MKSLATSNLSAVILGKGREAGESSVVWIDNGTYKGFGFIGENVAINDISALKNYIKSYSDNQDIQRILQVYLRRDREYRIIPISETQVDIF